MALAAAVRVALTAWLCVLHIGSGLISGVSAEPVLPQDDPMLPQGAAMGADVNNALTLGDYTLVMQEDCNLVLTLNGIGPLWDSGTASRGTNCFFILQVDGNAVIYKDSNFSSPVWSTGTCCGGDGQRYIIIQPDGNVCMYDKRSPGQALWCTNTAGR